jgi:hypothetical protein
MIADDAAVPPIGAAFALTPDPFEQALGDPR